MNWDFIFLPAQLQCEQQRTSLRRSQELPKEEDLSQFKEFVISEMHRLVADHYKKWDRHDFILMRDLIVCRLTMFNARRGGEPARLTLSEWEDAMNNVWIDQQRVQNVDDPLERETLDSYKLAYLIGKGSRKLVPILIPNDTVLPLQTLVEEGAGLNIPVSNPFVFANNGESNNHVIGWYSTHKVVNMIAGRLEKPSLLIADRFRHRVSTLFALLEFPDDVRS